MCAECNQYEAVPESNDDMFQTIPDVFENVSKFDCTMCRKYLPCQKASKKTDDIICGDFDNMFPKDVVEDVVETSLNEVVEEVLMICSGACEKCAGCPNALPHEANEGMDVEGICDEVGYMVKGVNALNCLDVN
jgi:hypothetical protein